MTSLVVVNTFGHATRYVARSQTIVVQLLHRYFFTFRTSYLFSESLASFLKYVDDVVIGQRSQADVVKMTV